MQIYSFFTIICVMVYFTSNKNNIQHQKSHGMFGKQEGSDSFV